MRQRDFARSTRVHIPRTMALLDPEKAARKLMLYLLAETDGAVRFKVVGLQGGREALIDMFEDDIDVALKFMSTTMTTLLLRFWDRRAEEEALARREAGDTGAAAGAGAGAEVASVAP